ncbi:MAG: thioesterase family protein [Baekduia sp.]
MTLPTTFFVSGGDGYRATELCRGPWDRGSAHGGPVAALIGREAERFDPDPALATVRFTIELLRPVPLGQLRFERTLLRPGKRVRLIGLSLLHEQTEVARATGLRVLRVPPDIPAAAAPSPPALPGPGDLPPAPSLATDGVGIPDGVELRAAYGSATEAGPAAYWFRVRSPLVDDEPVTPLTRALVAADFGNGIGSVLSIEEHVFINPDLTVTLHRLPEGDWVLNEARTWLHPGGGAIAEATLSDQLGPVGRAEQALFVAARSG